MKIFSTLPLCLAITIALAAACSPVGRCRCAPQGFMEAVVNDSIMAGTAMSRRSQYQFGIPPPGPRGQVDAGLGKALARGRSR